MSILDLLFPKRCVSCGKFGNYICGRCFSRQKIHFPQVCPECEKPAVDGRTHPGCKKKYSLDGLSCVFVYEGVVKAAIKKLKYSFLQDLAFTLINASILKLGTWPLKKSLILVPIPLHPARERWRGFNHASLLGKMLAEKLKVGFEQRILIRVRNTQPQMELKGKQRRENIKGAFSVLPDIPTTRYLNILLFDDVWTTGATMREAGKTLKRAGAKFVWGLTLAR